MCGKGSNGTRGKGGPYDGKGKGSGVARACESPDCSRRLAAKDAEIVQAWAAGARLVANTAAATTAMEVAQAATAAAEAALATTQADLATSQAALATSRADAATWHRLYDELLEARAPSGH
jgi:hypothetical protein